MAALTTEVLVILFLLLLNGIFSMSELALMTAKRSRLEYRAEEENDAGARVALELAAHPTAFLSTVQFGITLVGILAGAFGGAGIAEVLEAQFATIGWLAPYAQPAAFGVVVAVITYFSLIIGELVPKRIALGNPERVASFVARPMRLISRVGGPVVRALTGSTNLVLRVLGLGQVSEPGVTEQDIRALVEQGAESGVVHETERAIVEATFRLGDRSVREIMAPRPDVPWIDVADGEPSVRTQLTERARERFLLCRDEIDNVVGIVHAEDLLMHCMREGAAIDGAALQSLAREPLFVPSTMAAYRLLETFRQRREHGAIVLDEFGSVAGLVTLDDLLQALVGDVPNQHADEEGEILKQPDGSWVIDGATALADVEAALDLEPNVDRDVVTLGGFVMARLGRVPRPGDRFEWEGRRVEVTRMKGRRVERVVIAPPHRGDVKPPGSAN